MNYTCTKNETLVFISDKSEVLLSYRGIQYGSAHFHIIWKEGGATYSFSLKKQEKLVVGYGRESIELIIVGFNAEACTIHCDLPMHITLSQENTVSGNIHVLHPSRVELAKRNIKKKLQHLIRQQLDDNHRNFDSFLDVLTLLREVTEDIEVDVSHNLKQRKQLKRLLKKCRNKETEQRRRHEK